MTKSFPSAFVSRQAAPDGYLIVSVSVRRDRRREGRHLPRQYQDSVKASPQVTNERRPSAMSHLIDLCPTTITTPSKNEQERQ